MTTNDRKLVLQKSFNPNFQVTHINSVTKYVIFTGFEKSYKGSQGQCQRNSFVTLATGLAKMYFD